MAAADFVEGSSPDDQQPPTTQVRFAPIMSRQKAAAAVAARAACVARGQIDQLVESDLMEARQMEAKAESGPARPRSRTKKYYHGPSTSVGKPGSRRYNRWLNQRLLLGNLRRVMYESGEDLTDTDGPFHARSFWGGNRVIYYGGRRVTVAPGTEDIPNRAEMTQWTRLRLDWESSERFRKRRDLIRDGDESTSCTKRDSKPGLTPTEQRAFLEWRIVKIFRRQRKLLLHGPAFIQPFLLSLEEAIVQMLRAHLTPQQKTRAEDDDLSSSPGSDRSDSGTHRAPQHWYLDKNGSVLHHLDGRSASPHLNQGDPDPADIAVRYPDSLVIWGLSRFHRRLAHSLASAWSIGCLHVAYDRLQSPPGPSPIKQQKSWQDAKLIIIRLGRKEAQGFEWPSFPIAENIVHVISSCGEARRRGQSDSQEEDDIVALGLTEDMPV